MQSSRRGREGRGALSAVDLLRRRCVFITGLDLLLLFLVTFTDDVGIRVVEGQISFPVAKDADVLDEQNKYQQRRATLDRQEIPSPDDAKLEKKMCPHNLHMRWSTEVSSSVYSTPLIADINHDGRQEIVVPTFVHYLETLDGSDGEKVAGWPAYHRSTVHASPLLYDIDSDGVREIVLATYNGEILFFKPNGELMAEKIVIPRLRVAKDWYVGLAEPERNPDIGEAGVGVKDSHGSMNVKDITNNSAINSAIDALRTAQNRQAEVSAAPSMSTGTTAASDSSASKPESHQGDGAQTGSDNLQGAVKREQPAGDEPNRLAMEGSKDGSPASGRQDQPSGQQGKKEDVANLHRRRLLEDKPSKDKEGGNQIPGAENMENLDEDGVASFDVFKDDEGDAEGNDPGLEDEYRYDYDDILNDDMWGQEDFEENAHTWEQNQIEVDAHVLCTPVIADIDKDGVDELVVSVSYFFDREYYEDSDHKQELGKDIEPGNYVAGGIAVFNLQTKRLKWHQHLDLTTDRVSYRAYIYSSPTVIDLDDDGRLEVIVGTGLGYIYLLNSDGRNRENSPLQMGEIQGQVVAGDVNDDGLIELVACDTRGSVVVLNWRGQILWDRHVHSLISQGATIGDVDGDGKTDIVFGTASGHVHALTGKDGKNLTHFPFRTHGRIMSPILLTNLGHTGFIDPIVPTDVGSTRHLDLIFLGFDGYLYIINGRTGCADTVDIGETSYSMVLIDNVDGGNDMELIVATMSGNVYCFETSSKYDALMTWQSQAQGRNVHFQRRHRTGIFFRDEKHRDITGAMLTLRYEIVDASASAYLSGSRAFGAKLDDAKVAPKYDVEISMYGLGRKMERYLFTHTAPGVYEKTIKAPSIRTHATYRVEMVDRHQHLYSDEILISFHIHIYRILKWVLVIPLLFMVLAVVLHHHADREDPLPSFTRGHQL